MSIPRNANDIVAKHLTGAVPNGALDVIGIHDANVVRALPTEIPKIEVRQEFVDILFELDDGRLLHIEFQSTRESALYRFAAYDLAIGEKHRRKVRTVVLYTGDVHDAPSELDVGTVRYQVENVYLNRMDGDAVLETVKRHLGTGEWTERDRVRLSFAFHMRFARRTRDEAFGEIVELVQRLPDREEQNYLAALILGFSARILAPEQKERLREVLRMTDLLREFEEEFKEKWMQQGSVSKAREIAERMFRKGASVSDVVELTGLSEQEAEEIRKRTLDA
ncbi:transposase [Alicyclobacillus macrosporangiidus]|uniref:transposase n=1 Tax=Alicyclobacillus macrosporangiidus TaxID=392015 RepID=UPI0004969576|nr:transposase [Alicyclobacillus macrosporangiidus]